MFPCSYHRRAFPWKLNSNQFKGHRGFPQKYKRNAFLSLYHLRGLVDTGHTSPGGSSDSILSEKQRGGPTVSEGYKDRIRQQVCGFMEAVALRMGL